MRQPIAINELAIQPFTAFGTGGVLLVSGSGVERANPMTISWGMFGIMWGRPVMMVMVRPTRYTWEFIAEHPDFTVNWMPEPYEDALRLCGSKSGRDLNKWDATGLTPESSCCVASPSIAEAALVLECRTLYTDRLQPDLFADRNLLGLYNDDFHGLFFGDIAAAYAVEDYRCG